MIRRAIGRVAAYIFMLCRGGEGVKRFYAKKQPPSYTGSSRFFIRFIRQFIIA